MQDRRLDVSMASERSIATVSFTQRMVASEGFRALFREGMTLVEETASYLDGPGRTESKALPRSEALAYASESMRLTTRLMQLTSWLLLQRAVNEGELTRDEATREHKRIKVSSQDVASSADLFALLPEPLRNLVDRSLRLQERILMIDADLKGDASPALERPAINPVLNQLGALTAAFARR